MELDLDEQLSLSAKPPPASNSGGKKQAGARSVAASSSKARSDYKWNDKLHARPTGRRCTCCGKNDGDQDLTSSCLLLWLVVLSLLSSVVSACPFLFVGDLG